MANVLNLDHRTNSTIELFNICLEADGDLSFKANNTNCAGDTRVTIKDDSGNVGIGTTNPQSLLQVGDGLAGGYRSWMTRGLQVAWDTDNVFLGLKDQGADRKDSVLAWGDNTIDAFRFIFVGSSGSVDGEEIMRLQPNGNVGIGTTNPPTAKLEVRNGELGLDRGGHWWNLNVDSNGDLAFNANRLVGGDTRMLINDVSGNVGIGTTNPTQKLHVAGNICYTGTIGACSDLRYKTDIEPLTDSLNKVLSMHGMRYQWNQEAFPNHGFGEEPQIGFSGQEVEAICPEVVSTDSEGYKYIDYSRLTPVLVEAIKDQQQLIEQQKSALGEALAKIAQLEVTVQKMSADS